MVEVEVLVVEEVVGGLSCLGIMHNHLEASTLKMSMMKARTAAS